MASFLPKHDPGRDFEAELQPVLTSCTKLDVTLNNYIVRAKPNP